MPDPSLLDIQRARALDASHSTRGYQRNTDRSVQRVVKDAGRLEPEHITELLPALAARAAELADELPPLDARTRSRVELLLGGTAE